MGVKVVLKRCTDPQRAAVVAKEVAQWSGNTVDKVLQALKAQDICIRKDTDPNDANQLKKKFESFGAQIALFDSVTGSPIQGAQRVHSDDDDEEEEDGRVLSDAEYAAAIKSRGDIFEFESSRRVVSTQTIMMILAIALGIFFATRTIVKTKADFFEQIPENRVTAELKEVLKEPEKEEEDKNEDMEEKKKIKPQKKGRNGKTGGGGDPRARVTKKGVLGIISGKIKGKTVASADLFGKGGFASGIDAVLQGVGGLKSGGSAGVGRKGAAGIGYGAGYGSGFGGGSGGVDNLLGNLMGGGGGNLKLKKRGALKMEKPVFTRGGGLTGGRSRASIMRVVRQNLAALRYAYNKRLREKPGLKGRITVKFAIDEFGKVIFCSVHSSSMKDPTFEKLVVSKIRRWKFDKIDKPGDVTEVNYPFVFSE